MAALARLRLSGARWLALGWLAAVLLVAALAPWLPLAFPPALPDLAHVAQAPFGPGAHWLGTDLQGRDVLSNLVFGARTAVLLTLPAALLATLLGMLLGGAAGFWGNQGRWPVSYWLLAAGGTWWALGLPASGVGLAAAAVGAAGCLAAARWPRRPQPTWPVPLDAVVLGAAAALDAVPRLLLVLALAAVTEVSAPGMLVLLTLTAWPHPARLVRAQMLRVRSLPYVDAARAAGLPAGRVWWRHALLPAAQPLRAAFPLSIAGLLGLESTLSFLGVGLPPDVASWGHLLSSARNDPSAWWVFLGPSVCLAGTTLSLAALARWPPNTPNRR